MSLKIDRQNWETLIDIYKSEFPDVKFAHKYDPPEDIRVRLVYLFVRLVSFFKPDFFEWFNNRSVTVIGNWILFPSSHDWTQEEPDYKTFKALVHELRHLYQRRDNRFWELRYIVWPLPVLITDRAKWEMEAYSDSMWCDLFFLGYLQTPITTRAKTFVSVDYFWMSGFTNNAKWNVVGDLKNILAKINSGDYVPVTDRFIKPVTK